jgi:hypothetical protein
MKPTSASTTPPLVDVSSRYGWDLLIPVDLAGPPDLRAADAAVAALRAELIALPESMDLAIEGNDAAALVGLHGRQLSLPLVVRQARQAALRLRASHLDIQRARLAEVTRTLSGARDTKAALVTRLNAELAEAQGPLAEAAGRYDQVSRGLADVDRELLSLATTKHRG